MMRVASGCGLAIAVGVCLRLPVPPGNLCTLPQQLLRTHSDTTCGDTGPISSSMQQLRLPLHFDAMCFRWPPGRPGDAG